MSRNQLNKGFVLGFCILLISQLVAFNVVLQQFGGYDLSPMIDLSWRMANNESPGIDFINTMPPLIIIFIKLVSWGNLTWTDLTTANVIAVLLTYIVLYFISGNIKVSAYWFPSLAIILSLPLVYTNHIWHSSISQLSAIVFFYAVYIAVNVSKLNIKIILGVVFSSSLVVISKQNISLPLLMATIVFIIIFEVRYKFQVACAIFLGALVGVIISYSYLNISLSSFFYLYTSVFSRGKPDLAMYRAFMQVKTNYPLILFTALIMNLATRRLNYQRKNNVIYFSLFGALSLIPILTDWDTKFNNISLPLFIFMTIIFMPRFNVVDNDSKFETTSDYHSIIVKTIGILMLTWLLAMYGGYKRERMMHVGPFYEVPINKVVSNGYFSGLRTGNNYYSLLEEISIAKSRWSQSHIYFGPRIEFGYMYTQTKSPKGLPLWFHPGTSYALFDEVKVLKSFINNNFDTLVFAKNDRTRMPPKILEYIEFNFQQVGNFVLVDVYRKK